MSNDEVCLYATVFNNVDTLDETIKSVWRPNYTIVITDNYSLDGTWEKLQELRKEYNLLIYRLKSSRGKGRDYSLRHCPDNSKTAYFDLDMKYNENFHKIIEWSPNDKRINAHYLFVTRKDIILNKGGWRDLNYGEDNELYIRVGFDYFIPVITATNLFKILQRRERRYAKNKIQYYYRSFRNEVDRIRGFGYNFNEIKPNTNIPILWKLGLYLAFLVAKLKGIYRCDKKVHNIIKVYLMRIEKLTNHSELGISDDYFGCNISIHDIKGKEDIISLAEKVLNERIGSYRKYSCQGGSYIVYVKNKKGLKNMIDMLPSNDFICEEITTYHQRF